MDKFALYMAAALAVALPALTVTAHGRPDKAETASTTEAWVPLWALKAAAADPTA
ncbi:hypothetical protein [Kitasatospora sp. NPDC001547]|uniref:hypothetical protein n=1 Tax=Kitasatospora sp. NPDC001547 TaxID=3364015 RepID=UPI0036A2CCA5|nr:hypothetical protein KitaXyl93_12800 [Kitasatospora sp. Xyl93]